MKSFLKQIETKFLELQETDDKGRDDIIRDASDDDADNTSDSEMDSEELDEISTTGAVAGYNTPGAFTTAKKFKKKKFTWAGGQVNESVNTPPSFNYDKEEYQRPESHEEEWMDKFAYATDGETWQHEKYEYPSKDLTHTPGQSKRKDLTKQHKLSEMIDSKYQQIIESYKNFATGDPKKSPERKVKETIQEIAKKLHEIETLVNYNSKLKTEAGVTSTAYGPSTTKALTKISERLIKISERVRSLGE
jgi:hypothetical protein